jgi:hypothetical protein
MYTADLVMYLGFVLMAPSAVALGVYAVAVLALYRQARVEDAFLARRFPEAHRAWANRTGLLLPALGLALLLLPGAGIEAAAERPQIRLIVADNLGDDDLSARVNGKRLFALSLRFDSRQ